MISFVIVNYNNSSNTIECLQSIFLNKIENYKIVVVDNSDNNQYLDEIFNWCVKPFPVSTLSVLKLDFNNFQSSYRCITISEDEIYIKNNMKYNDYDIILIKQKSNNGFASANNLGIKFLMNHFPDIVWYWLLNNDTVVPKNCFKEFISYLNSLPKEIGLVGHPINEYTDPLVIQSLYAKYNSYTGTARNIVKCETNGISKLLKGYEYPVGASMLLRNCFVHEVGLLNEKYYLYFEEIDLVMRAKAKNFRILFYNEFCVFHKGSASIKAKRASNKSFIGDMVNIRNRIQFTYSYFPFKIPFVYFSLLMAVFNRIRRSQYGRAGIILTIMARMGKSSIDEILFLSKKIH